MMWWARMIGLRHTCSCLRGWIEAGGSGRVTQQAAFPFFIVLGLLLYAHMLNK